MRARLILTALISLVTGAAAGTVFGPELLERFQPVDRSAAEADASSTTPATETSTWYSCGMHPEVIQDHPGDCPKCGMNLTPVSRDRASGSGEIHINPVTEQNMGIRTAKVTTGPVRRTVRTVGFVEYDESRMATVTTKVDGWIEKLHVDQTGAQVHEGDPLFDLYSPALFSAQEEYLATLRNRQQSDFSTIPRARLDSDALIDDARTRLRFFDVSEQQIGELERTRKVRKTLTIRAPFTGIVTHKNVVEGGMVTAGSDLFQIADLSTVWVIAKVFENDLPYVRLGGEALMTLSYIPGKTFRGQVTYVYPYLEDKTREISVRMEFHNPGYELKPGMYTTVMLSGEVAAEATLVPDTAVIRSGTRAVAFTVSAPGRFRARNVTLGARAEGGRLQVLSGLTPGETVVVSGQFLLDSESRLREAALKFTEPGMSTEAAQPEHPRENVGRGELYYVCPMPEHVDVLYNEAGSCPLCSMELVPVRRESGRVADSLGGDGDGKAD